MNNVEIIVYSRLAHNRMIVTGFKQLARDGDINLTITEKYNQLDNVLDKDIVEVVVDNKIKIAFDMMDGYVFDVQKTKKYIKTINFYFKRSFSLEYNEKYLSEVKSKIYPLSFNWDVSYFSNPMEWSKDKSDIKILIKKFIMRNDVKYYSKPASSNSGKIIFMCRLWAADGSEPVTESEIVQRNRINKMRIEIVRALRQKYGDNFVGGVENNPTAQELCPDLIFPMQFTKKPFYIKEMKKAAICIASTGLHDSIGWKFSEYVAAGKAIVSEALNYEVIGDFEEGRNYLAYSTVDECVEAVDKLYNNPNLIKDMEDANKEYYKNYANPKKQMQYVLNVVNETI